MNAIHRTRSLWLALLAVAALPATPVSAATLQDIVRDTQRMENTNGEMTMVWWLPQQFWEESLRANAAMPQAARDQVLGVLGEYVVVAMLRAKAGPLGITDAVPKAELVKNVRFEVNGKLIEPLDPASLSSGAQLLLAQLKPTMAATMGQIGQGIEFAVYPRKVDGQLLFDPAQPGSLQITLFDRSFPWRLPLGSLLPERVDSKTGEKFPGNYEFNPYTGAKLQK
jgi:hypothetical protein